MYLYKFLFTLRPIISCLLFISFFCSVSNFYWDCLFYKAKYWLIYFIIRAKMINTLIACHSVVLIHIIYHLFFSPKNIPFLSIFCSYVTSIFKSFLNTNTNLSFILDLLPKIMWKILSPLKKLLIDLNPQYSWHY